MKTLFCLMSTFLISWNAKAASLPDCWNGEVVPGSYIAFVNLRETSKENLIRLLSKANGKAITASGYPSFSDEPVMFLHIVARPTRDGISPRQEVEAELSSLLNFNGFMGVHCNHIAQPQPRMGTRN